MHPDSFKQIVGLAQEAKRREILQVPGESRGRFYLWNEADNKYEPLSKVRDLDDQFLSLPTLADYAAYRQASALWGFWYSRTGVIFDWEDFDFATLSLNLSPQIQKLAEWEKSHRPLKQDQAVLALRTIFPGMTTPSDLLAIVSNVQFKIDEQGRAVTGQGTRSVGRAMEARLENRDRIPDLVVFSVPVWENGGNLITSIKADVICALDADPTNQTFLFIPLAGSVERAIGVGEDALRGILEAQLARAFGEQKPPPIYHGTPTQD